MKTSNWIKKQLSLFQRIIFLYSTWSATVKFRSHGDMSIPCFWMDPDVPRYNRFIQFVPYHCVSVRVGSKYLENTIHLKFCKANWSWKRLRFTRWNWGILLGWNRKFCFHASVTIISQFQFIANNSCQQPLPPFHIFHNDKGKGRHLTIIPREIVMKWLIASQRGT